jgi:hypothetical protein
MEQLALAAGLGLMSIVVVVEAAWLRRLLVRDERLRRWLPGWLIALARVIFLIGLPYIGLISGLVPARLLGLTGLEQMVSLSLGQPWPEVLLELQRVLGTLLLAWQPMLGPFSLIGLTALILVALALWFNHELRQLPDTPPNNVLLRRLYASPLAVVLDAVHWTFYRAVVWLLTGSLYVGTWGGLTLLSIELMAVSYFGQASPARQQQYLWQLVIATVTSVSFLFAPDFWLTVVLHAGLAWLIGSGLATSAGRHALQPSTADN